MIHRHYIADLFGANAEYRNSKGEGVSKTMLYMQYLKDLNIKPLTDDQGRSYVEYDSKLLLDEYHRRRSESKQSLAEFLSELRSSNIVPSRSETLQQNPVWMEFVEAIVGRLSTPQDPLSPQEQLQRVSDRGWVVSTSQLAQILGVKRFGTERYGFLFVKSGRVGREVGWMVHRKERRNFGDEASDRSPATGIVK